MTAANLGRHELVGMQVLVAESKNRSLAGLAGTVRSESMRMLCLETPKGRRSVPKDVCVLEFAVGGKPVRLDGASIQKRPFDRVGARR